ncbi:hypothetical protein ACIQLG_16750 [Terribacillus saccharophilus]|uniref:hypothetical protein n=1 Tax=Terribacillus saccharophilus TaxID=361277 RepID=UPI0037F9C256
MRRSLRLFFRGLTSGILITLIIVSYMDNTAAERANEKLEASTQNEEHLENEEISQ